MLGACDVLPHWGHAVTPGATSAPQAGHFMGPLSAAGGLKHMACPFLDCLAPLKWQRLLERIREGQRVIMTSARPNRRVISEGKAGVPYASRTAKRPSSPSMERFAAYFLNASSRVPTPSLL